MTEPRWIRFEECAVTPGRKTEVWNVVAKDGDVILGSVFWYGAWRRYVFGSTIDHEDGVIFEERCLRDIAEFVEARTREHKVARAAAGGEM